MKYMSVEIAGIETIRIRKVEDKEGDRSPTKSGGIAVWLQGGRGDRHGNGGSSAPRQSQRFNDHGDDEPSFREPAFAA